MGDEDRWLVYAWHTYDQARAAGVALAQPPFPRPDEEVK